MDQNPYESPREAKKTRETTGRLRIIVAKIVAVCSVLILVVMAAFFALVWYLVFVLHRTA